MHVSRWQVGYPSVGTYPSYLLTPREKYLFRLYYMFRRVVWQTCRAQSGQLSHHAVPAGYAGGVASSATTHLASHELRGSEAVSNYHDDDTMKQLWKDAKLNPRSEDSWLKLMEALIVRDEVIVSELQVPTELQLVDCIWSLLLRSHSCFRK